MVPPYGGDFIYQWKLGIGVGGHHHYRKVGTHEKRRQRDEGQGDEHELSQRCRTRKGDPAAVIAAYRVPVRPGEGKAALDQGQHEGQDQGEMAEFGDHGPDSPFLFSSGPFFGADVIFLGPT